MKLLSLLLITVLSACADNTTVTNFKEVEDSRLQARANAEYQSKLYRVENPRLDGYNMVVKTDTTISETCPNGDGWATVNFLKLYKDEYGKDAVDKITVRCSTVSLGLGCYREEDFRKKTISNEEGSCQSLNKVPYPLPKLIN